MIDFKKISKMLGYPIIQMTPDVKKFARRIVIINCISFVIADLLVFSLKGAQLALNKGYILLTFIMLLLYYGQRTINSIIDTFTEYQCDSYDQLITSESTEKILMISNLTRNKVFKTVNNLEKVIEHPEVIKVVKDYTSDYWSLATIVPSLIIHVLVLFVMIIANLILELQDSTITETVASFVLITVCIIAYFNISKKRVKVMHNYRKIKKANESQVEVCFTELKTTEFLSSKDFEFHANILRDLLNSQKSTEKNENLKLNKVFIIRSIIATAIMFSLIIIKFICGSEFTLNTFISIIAISSVYSTILNNISTITNRFERLSDIFVDLDSLHEEFDKINTVYERELEKTLIIVPIDYVTVTQFSCSQDPSAAFELRNNQEITMQCGQVYLVYGHTGCGKSTLISLLTGRIGFKESSPIEFSNGKLGYLNSIAYQTDSSLCNNFVLNEIALSNSPRDDVDKEKMFAILKGFNLWEEFIVMAKMAKCIENKVFSSDEELVFSFLETRKIKEFSSGQMQRIALTKLLYNLDESIQLVALDEPFNRLDDKTAKKCVAFTKEYVQRDQARILILATHQVEICRDYSDVEISFNDNLGKSIIQVKRSS